MSRVRLVWLVAVALLALLRVAVADAPAKYVIQISVDGLGASYLQALLDRDELPTFKRLQVEGAYTHNARTDCDFTITLPNHTCMVTGRPVRDRGEIVGHQWTLNTDPGERTLHSNRHDYVASAFDVAHDAGLRTAMFASKSKFSLYDQSYDQRAGDPDKTGEDNGRDKIDLYVRAGCDEMVDRFISEMKAEPFNYSFVHFADTDSAGHSKKWGSPEYNAAPAQGRRAARSDYRTGRNRRPPARQDGHHHFGRPRRHRLQPRFQHESDQLHHPVLRLGRRRLAHRRLVLAEPFVAGRSENVAAGLRRPRRPAHPQRRRRQPGPQPVGIGGDSRLDHQCRARPARALKTRTTNPIGGRMRPAPWSLLVVLATAAALRARRLRVGR